MFRRHWRTGGRWVFWNGVGMVGLWGVGWVAFLFLVDTPWSELVDRGQFFLYSVGTLVQVMYLLTKDKKITTFPQRSLLTSISVLFLMMCAVLFGATVLSNLTEITVVESKVGWLRWSGVGIFLASMLVGVVATIAAEDQDVEDITVIGKQSSDRLNHQISRNLGQP